VFPNVLDMVHQVPNGYLLCSQFVPNSSTLYSICFAQNPPLVKYIFSPKENYSLCLFWEWLKYVHHPHFYFRRM